MKTKLNRGQSPQVDTAGGGSSPATNGDGIAAVGNGTDIDQTQSMANGTTTAMTSRSRYEKSRRNTAAETMGKQTGTCLGGDC